MESLSVEAKIVYTGFCVFSLLALAVSALYYYDLVGTAPLSGVKEYYAGEIRKPEGERQPPGAVTATAPELDLPKGDAGGDEHGPEIELPDEEPGSDPQIEPAPPSAMVHKLIVPITRRKLLEVTHFHLFTLPVFLLIISHLFMLCRMRPATKLLAIGSATASAAAHMAAPWAIFWAGPGWAWLMPITGVWMTASMLVLTGLPMWAMWRSSPAPA